VRGCLFGVSIYSMLEDVFDDDAGELELVARAQPARAQPARPHRGQPQATRLGASHRTERYAPRHLQSKRGA
jgi:hypothetical protein